MPSESQTVTVRRVIEYDIEIPPGLGRPPEEAAIAEAKVSSTAEADRETFEVVLFNKPNQP
jgi:hypothetical protein